MNGIDFSVLLATIGIPLQIVLIDLLLSADNALMIALAVRALPREQMRTAVLFGTAGAIVLRLAMASVVLILLAVPGLKIAAGIVLLLIAVKLAIQRGDTATQAVLAGGTDPEAAHRAARADMLGAVVAIIVADAVMSLDNVVAIAAVADGSLVLLGFGLALSIPMLVYGSTLIRQILNQNAWLVRLAAMLLGWIAGGIAVSDAAVAAWVATSAPALVVAVPLACAIFVLWQAWILAPRPWPHAAIVDGVTQGEPDAG